MPLDLNHSYRDLKNAISEFELMKSSKTFEEYESHWRKFLMSIEQVYIKARLGASDFPKFHGWNSKYDRMRKQDPLLRYLGAARNCEAHSIQEIVQKQLSRLKIQSTGSTSVRSIVLIDNEIYIQGEGSPLKVEFEAERVKAMRVENRGEIFHPPLHHDNMRITDPTDPLLLGKIILDFLDNYLKKIQNVFGKV